MNFDKFDFIETKINYYIAYIGSVYTSTRIIDYTERLFAINETFGCQLPEMVTAPRFILGGL